MTWMTSKLYKTLDDVDGVDLQLVIKLAKRTSPTHPIYNAMQKPNPSWTGILQRVSSWNVNQWSRLRPQTHWLNNEWINESVNDARRRPKPMMMASESGASSTFWINDGRVFPLMQLIQTRLWKKKRIKNKKNRIKEQQQNERSNWRDSGWCVIRWILMQSCWVHLPAALC